MNRASLLANIPRILDHVKGQRAAIEGGQAGLFGAPVQDELALRELPEMELAQKLYHERELLGGFLSDHPVTAFVKPEVLAARSHRCRDRLAMEQAGTSARIVVVGLVREWMDYGAGGTLQVEDETGALFIRLQRREAERYQWILRRDFVLALRLTPRYGIEKTDLIVQEAKKLGEFKAEPYVVPPDPREKKGSGGRVKKLAQPKKKARR